MTRVLTITAASALLLTAPAMADLNVPAPSITSAARGNCDLLASNTVRASFVGLQDMVVQTIHQPEPVTVQVAVFDVIDSLGYRKYVRYGDGQLLPGTRFTVSLSRELPGQPAHIADTLSQMQPGEEAVLKIDHLYMLGNAQNPEGEPIRACSRMARRNDQPTPTTTPDATNKAADPAATPQAPAAIPAPAPVQMTVMPQSRAQSFRVQHYFDSRTGQQVTRMFINGVEVDPQTKQPLNPQQQLQPQMQTQQHPSGITTTPINPVPPPAAESKAEEDDDTIIETPQVTPTPATPAQPQTQPGTAIPESDSF